MQDRPNLDLMRAFAVGLVVLDHVMIALGKSVAGGIDFLWVGVFGVYLFFVHTCLVLMWSLERRPHTLNFYVRRIFRIYPLAMVICVVIVAVPLFRQGIASLLTPTMFASNLLLTQDLWHRAVLTGVLWTLPLELRMYLVLPVLFAFVYRERSRWPIIVLWCFSVAVARAMAAPPRSNELITVIPHFIPGVIAYAGFMTSKPKLPAWSFVLFLLSIAAWFTLKPSVERGWLVCFVLGLALPYFRQISGRWIIRASHEIAKYSYSIYLIHILVIQFAFKRLTHVIPPVQILFVLAATAILAVIAYHAIENPGISSAFASQPGSTPNSTSASPKPTPRSPEIVLQRKSAPAWGRFLFYAA